ncbi:heterokaryon incompatibility protein-domain-containing protein [Sordaria brevicollis]|uniref:Heterokaryon incompatibility protein-domain-containing protein n=1 Tax=Sordaria brevicollis TaxID=83679 RepID=A0AAE0PF64_SORBR|nr:heterokaryon incompatibility protein-domain-containing protein [Sordaria brevicollis]
MTEPTFSGPVQLCEPCSRLDFKSMFTSHGRPINERQQVPLCDCRNTFDDRERHGWPTPGDPIGETCAFCAFYLACQIQSQDVQVWKYSSNTVLSLVTFHSLRGYRLRCVGVGEDHDSGDCVQDVSAMQIHGYPSRLDARFAGLRHAILRLVDYGYHHSFSSMTTMLTRGREAGGGILARKLVRDKVNYRLIREWLQLCRAGHHSCDPLKANQDDVDVGMDMDLIPGFQVIDCITKTIVPFTSISGNTSSVEQSKAPEYVTLSYVWGQAPCEGPFIGQQQLSLPHPLPLTISDTIQVVQCLGYRYLWIDRYCIPQDDLPAKQIQIENMGRIFSRSVMTIIAAAGEGPEYGLPGVSERPRAEQLTVQVDATDGKGISLALYEMPKTAIEGSKWFTRGWTYQEGLLSRRRLVFMDKMVYFQCYEMHGDEVASLPILDKPGGKDTHFDEIRCLSLDDEDSDFGYIFPRRIANWSNPDNVWDQLEEFSKRQLSFDADTLDAVDGIFEIYAARNRKKQKEDKVLFFYGIPIIPPRYSNLTGNIGAGSQFVDTGPTYRLIYGLLWESRWPRDHGEDLSRFTTQQPLSRFRRQMFPSWTWAGWKSCPVNFPRFPFVSVFDSDTEIYVEYEIETIPSTSDQGLAHPQKPAEWRRLGWEQDNEKILELARNGAYKIPARLVIRGPVLDVRLKWHDGESDPNIAPEKHGKWTITWPEFVKGQTVICPKVLFLNTQPGGLPSKEEDEVQALALILVTLMEMEHILSLEALMLKPMASMSNGQTEAIYERVHKLSLKVDKTRYESEWTPLPDLWEEMEVTIC